ncbi:MAG: precorrin-6A reductase [Leptolyngbya sp. SIO1E4]|nr:precorrin-6A reductase [Leptolyngbya sp. SIO1E4]
MSLEGRLWLIGGTQESRWLVQRIVKGSAFALRSADRLPFLISVTTAAARQLYPEVAEASVWVGQLTADQGDAFIASHQIAAILDASHPFATDISHLAIALAQRHGLPYLRYERALLSEHAETPWQDAAGRPGNVLLPQLTDVLTGNYLRGERTLLTVGYRMLSCVEPWQAQGTLFARILPSPPALAAALAAGFTPDRIIALRPPMSAPLEKALWQQWRITQVVTKASGLAGGEDRKLAIAAELGVRLIRLARPPVCYPAQTDCLEVATEFALNPISKDG